MLSAYYAGPFYSYLKINEGVKAANFSSDSRNIITTSSDSISRIYDLEGNKINELIGHKERILSASFSSDGRYIVTASADNSSRLWKRNGNLEWELLGHKDDVIAANFSNDSRFLVTGSLDRTFGIWDINNKQLIAFIELDKALVETAYFSQDSKYIVTISRDSLRLWLWGAQGAKIARTFPASTAKNSVDFSPNSHAALVVKDNLANIWNLNSWNNQPIPIKSDGNPINSVKFSPDGQFVVTVHDKGAILWDSFGEKIQQLMGHDEPIISTTFSPDKQYIITVSRDRHLCLWRIKDKVIKDIKDIKGYVHARDYKLRESRESKKLNKTSSDGRFQLVLFMDSLKLIDERSKETIVLDGYWTKQTTADFSFESPHLMMTKSENVIQLWSLTGKEIYRLPVDRYMKISTAEFSQDGDSIVATMRNGSKWKWLIDSKKILKNVKKQKVWHLDQTAKKEFGI